MKLLVMLAVLLGLIAGVLAAEPASAALPRHVLTNEGLVVLAGAGVGEGLLVDLIRHKRTSFDTSAEALALLARQGISETVLRAVVEKQEQLRLRPPRVVVNAVPAGTPAGPVEVPAGEVVMLPSGGKRPKSGADRWYTLRFEP